MSVLEEILAKCEAQCVSRIQFDLYLKYTQHRIYFPDLENLTIHNIGDETFIDSIKSLLISRMNKASRKTHSELCIGLNKKAVSRSVEDNNFILFLKIDDVPEGVVIGNINDNKRKSMFFVNILCSNPIKYSGIGKHLLDFFKTIIHLNFNPMTDDIDSKHFSIHLKSVNSKNAIDFYERNGMRNESEVEDDDVEDDDLIYPYLWKLSYMHEDDVPPEILDYKINEGVKWVSPRRFSERRAALNISENSKPSTSTRKNPKR